MRRQLTFGAALLVAVLVGVLAAAEAVQPGPELVHVLPEPDQMPVTTLAPFPAQLGDNSNGGCLEGGPDGKPVPCATSCITRLSDGTLTFCAVDR